jgi:hypothetical protein
MRDPCAQTRIINDSVHKRSTAGDLKILQLIINYCYIIAKDPIMGKGARTNEISVIKIY